MDTIKAHDHVITDDHIEFIQDAIDYWMIHKPKRTRQDRDYFHHLSYVFNKLRLSPFINTINYERTKKQWSVYDYLIASLTETHRQLPDMHPDIPDNLPDNDMLEAMAFVAKMKESADRIGAGFVGGFIAPDGTKFVMTNMNEEDTNSLTPQSLRESND